MSFAATIPPVARLGTEERETLAAVRRVCGTGSDSVRLREDVSRLLTRYLRADAYCAMEIDPATTLPVHDVNHGWPREYVVPLVEKALFASRTADTGLLTRHPRRAVIVDELLEGDSPKHDPYFQHHVLPFGYRHEIQFMCISGGLPRALFTFNRRTERGSFEARHLRLLEAVAPHVGAAMHAACVRSALEERPATDTGFIVLGPEGGVELANRVGARLLESGPGHRSSLALDVFMGLMRRSLREGNAPPISAMSFTDRSTSSTYRLVGERTIADDGRPRTIILLEPSRPVDSEVGLLRLGLTAREALVVTEVLRDENLVACAARLGCAPATVTRHVKNVFVKLSVGSRRELALRLLGAPPNVTASPHGLP
jgi:DNA-binding CsgD family transcriptional regulator